MWTANKIRVAKAMQESGEHDVASIAGTGGQPGIGVAGPRHRSARSRLRLFHAHFGGSVTHPAWTELRERSRLACPGVIGPWHTAQVCRSTLTASQARWQ